VKTGSGSRPSGRGGSAQRPGGVGVDAGRAGLFRTGSAIGSPLQAKPLRLRPSDKNTARGAAGLGQSLTRQFPQAHGGDTAEMIPLTPVIGTHENGAAGTVAFRKQWAQLSTQTNQHSLLNNAPRGGWGFHGRPIQRRRAGFAIFNPNPDLTLTRLEEQTDCVPIQQAASKGFALSAIEVLSEELVFETSDQRTLFGVAWRWFASIHVPQTDPTQT